MGGSRPRVAFVQSYVPAYRKPFFEALHSRLADDGIGLLVAASTPHGPQASRGDTAQLHGSVALRSVGVRLGARHLSVKRISALTESADLVILEQMRRNLESYPLLLSRRRTNRVALFGHGATVVQREGPLARGLERRLTNGADWLFAYTSGSADRAVAGGFPADHITVVNNAIDTSGLRALRGSVTADDVQRLRAELDLGTGPVGLFVGALDPSKRVDFLLEAAERVHRAAPGFRLVVAGDGPLRQQVLHRAERSTFLRYVGPAGPARKSGLAGAASLLLMPGRVGLVAVDAFALGLPVVTTDWPWHAPEVEYLEHGRNAWVSGDSVAGYAQAVLALLTDEPTRRRLSEGCTADAEVYTLGAMVDRFAAGVQAVLTRAAATA